VQVSWDLDPLRGITFPLSRRDSWSAQGEKVCSLAAGDGSYKLSYTLHSSSQAQVAESS
jgi:hypothetical protein